MTWCSISESRQFGWLACVVLAMCCCATAGCAAAAETFPVEVGADGRLVYDHDKHQNRVPDFSHCGYAGADREIPNVPVKAAVAPADGDDGALIQAAIDQIAALPLDVDGYRGAVLLAPGQFDVAGQLRLSASGIVLRGSGAGENGTTLLATGVDRRALVRVDGIGKRQLLGVAARVVDKYVPVGATKLHLDSAGRLQVGDTVLVIRPSTAEWVAELGMKAFGVGWRPGTRDIRWDRVITAIDGNTVSLDAPITTAIDARLGGATVQAYEWPGRIDNVGVEDLRMQSVPGSDSPLDEDHAWFGVTIQNAENAWVRRVEFRHFAGGAVALWENTKWVTVEDCIALEPISELGGYRRHTFFTQGQLTLFLRCWSEHGRHDFAVGHCAPGPNAFVNCYAAEAQGDSGPIESWASGVLYDNVRIDGAGLSLENHWAEPTGTGWSAGNCMLWQCRAATVRNFRPPGANNWAIGCWAVFAGDGTMMAPSDSVRPQSLYQAQLRERVGSAAAARVDPILGRSVGATNPTVVEAARFVAQSDRPARQLIDVIRERFDIASPSQNGRDSGGSPSARPRPPDEPSPSPSLRGRGSLSVHNGWLVIDGRLKTGGHYRPLYWRGTMRPDEAPAMGPAITRFAPGRIGTGLTDDLQEVAEMMASGNIAVYEHHYGLWYDRRRDDHLMVRRANGDVAPPFYEQAFARSGQGTAWDGLSKYDLTKPDPWYWGRLRDFARLCDERGLVLLSQHYFQHNILEAGAHWTDCPWRPANNVNDMGMPEPPVYIGDKRQFMAPLFYDVTGPGRRELHRGYIRQCLDGLADSSNVIHLTSAEYTGPLEFVQFWLDTVIEWEQEHNRAVLIGLSCTKDVQDAILADPLRSPDVDLVDIRYWAYTAGGGLYAPEGGKNLAPRQFLRPTRQKAGGFEAIVKAVREYRTRFPDMAVTYYAGEECPSISDGWAVLIGGGSLPDVKLPARLAEVIPTMQPTDGIVSGRGQWCLGRPGGDYLIYAEDRAQTLNVNLPGPPARYRVHWIDRSGDMTSSSNVTADRPVRLRPQANALWLERIGGE
jgi:hypothetical protein